MPKSALTARFSSYQSLWRGLMMLAVLQPIAVYGDESSQSELPFAGTDTISVLDQHGKLLRLGGRIEDIAGEILTIRRSGRSQIELYSMSDVTQLSFPRHSSWEDGLTHHHRGELGRALEFYDKALRSESRQWAWNELQATAAKACIELGQRKRAVRRIEEIFANDNRTRHVSILPLVWDSRLPESERLVARPEDLNSSSVIQQLVAASALLHDPDNRSVAKSRLEKIRRTSGLKRISELAEAQLWRTHLFDRSEQPLINLWQDRVRQLPVSARSGPQFVMGRLFAQKHDYDNAVLAFLWTPLMSPTDRALAAQSLAEGISSLQLAGRHQEAAVLSVELQHRFPSTSAAQTRLAADRLKKRRTDELHGQ